MLIYFCVYLVINFAFLLVKPLQELTRQMVIAVFKALTDGAKEIIEPKKKNRQKSVLIDIVSFLFFTPILIFFLISYFLLLPFVFIFAKKHGVFERMNGAFERMNEERELKERKNIYKNIKIPFIQKIYNNENFFNFNDTQIFYIESEYNILINNYLDNNYETVLKIFSTKTERYPANRFQFIYVPKLVGKWQQYFPNLAQIIKYNFPHYTETEIAAHIANLDTITTVDFSKIIFNSLGYEGEIYSGFLRARPAMLSGFDFIYAKIDVESEKELVSLIWFYLDHLRDGESLSFQKTPLVRQLAQLKAEGKENEIADLLFDSHALEIAEEIKQKIASLQVSGYNQLLMNLVAQQLANPELLAAPKNNPLAIAPPKLSRLVITQDFKIFLPDFNNLEIVMTPLPKAIFLLFLQYPLGMLLKHLPDYQNKLFEIYKQISYRETPDEMFASIKDVTNPAKNSINEKCSRIKEAFVRQFDDSIAKHYYITGERGKRKYISLNRDLVKWE